MASLMESYEQQYSTLTAEITTKTGTIPNLTGSKYAPDTMGHVKLSKEFPYSMNMVICTVGNGQKSD